MPPGAPLIISAAVEGDLDEAVVVRLAHHVGVDVGPVYGKRGKEALKARLLGYNRAAQYWSWLVLVDLDQEADCAPPLRQRLLPDPAPRMCFRIAVHAVEAWLLADRERLGRYLAVPPARLAANPETIANPKQFLVQLAARSRSREVKRDMVPTPESGRRVGPGYTGRLVQYVIDTQRGWRPEVAAGLCDSLGRTIRCLRSLTR
jgi:hypothetical protein